MRILRSKLILALAALFILPAANAVAAPLTLTCYVNGSVFLTLPVMSAFFQTGTPAQEYFSVTTDIARFDGLIFQSFFTPTIDYCALSSDMRTFPSSITLENIVANVAPTGSYTQLIFSYKGLTATNGPAVDLAHPTVTQTPEEKSRSLAAFIARVPAPVVPATTVTK